MGKARYLRILAIGLACCMTCVLMAGCSSEPKAQEEETLAAEEAPAYELTVGEGEGDELPLLVKNATGQEIVAVSATLIGSEGGPAALKMSESSWESDAVAGLFLGAQNPEAASGSSASSAASADAGDAVLNEAYDVELTLADGSTHVLHQVVPSALKGAEDISICFDAEGSVVYLTYQENGVQMSTQESELQIAAEAQLAAEAEEKAAAEAEAAAALQAEAQAQAAAAGSATNGGSTGNAATGGSTGGGYDTVDNSGGGANQGEDSCVDDVIFN